MRPVDFQNITAQIPGVERAHQTRPQQPESEQRQYTSIVQQAEDQKLKEAQATPQTREARIQIEKEKERQLNLSKKERKKKEKEEEEKKEEQKKLQRKESHRGKKIDIII